MFNLTETFKKEYETFLNEQASSDFDNAFEALEESQKQADEAFVIIKEYFNLYAKSEGLLEADTVIGGKGADADIKDKDVGGTSRREAKKEDSDIMRKFIEVMSNVSSGYGDARSTIGQYEPVVGQVAVKSITEMKFPQNIIFFIDSLVKWIINLVRKFISFFTNAIRRFFNLEQGKDTVTEDDLKLKLQQAKEIKAVAMPISYQKGSIPKAVSMLGIDTSDIERVRNIFGGRDQTTLINASVEADGTRELLVEAEPQFEKSERKQVVGISIDISKDMEQLHQLLQYFLDLYDNAYGSNQEYLFGVSDLEILLNLFRQTIDDIAEGRAATYAIGGKLTQMDLVNAGKLKDNLVRTQVNTDKLKEVYVQIQEGIKKTLTIIAHKQLLAAEGMGIGFRFYSAATYTQMIRILNIIKPRIAQTEQIQTEMEGMKKMFDNIVIQLSKQRQAIAGFGAVTYTSVYQRKINELFDGARYVSQTVSLRLATLGLYLRQLRDIYEAIANTNAINSRSNEILRNNIPRM